MSGPIIPPTVPGAVKPSAPSGQIVQIVSLPDALKNVARAIRVEGEVIQQNKDGSLRVRTPQGDIDVTLRGKQPQPGAKLEIDIPPGNPPRNVTVRPAPPPVATPAPLPQTPSSGAAPTPPPPVPQSPLLERPASPVPSGTASPQPLPPASQPPLPTQPVQPSQNAPPPATGQQATPVVTAPSAPPLPSLPPLQPGMTVILTPAPQIPLTASDRASGLPAAPSLSGDTPAQAPQAKPQNTLLTSLVQAVKSVLPDSSPALQSVNILFGAERKSALPSPALPSPQTPAGTQTLPPPVLLAKIVSLTLPTGQSFVLSPQANTLSAPATPTSQPATATQSAAVPPSPAAFPASPAAPTLTVTVAQVTPQNQPVLAIPVNNTGAAQNFILQSPPATVPVGTQIVLQPQLSAPALSMTPQMTFAAPAAGPVLIPTTLNATASALPPAWRSLLPLMQPASIWPLMDDVFQSFYQATPQAAQILARTIPSPANMSNLGASVMLFAAALKAGDLQGWIGEKKLEMIQKLGKGELIARLAAETSTLSAGNDTPPTEWKSFPMPMLWQNEISKVLFHVRREPDENDQNAEMGTRFIMDLSLTRMGEVQLDGLVRGARLDLIVRTEMPVSFMMQEAMQKAYADALDGSGIYGEIGFQGDMSGQMQVLGRQDNLIASL